jgi:hypothetical protein
MKEIYRLLTRFDNVFEDSLSWDKFVGFDIEIGGEGTMAPGDSHAINPIRRERGQAGDAEFTFGIGFNLCVLNIRA